MIEERGVVRGTDGEFALVETEKKSLCGGCATTLLCNTMTGDKPILTIRAEDAVGAAVGDEVTIGISERAYMKTAVLIYVMPVVALLSVGVVTQGFNLLHGVDKNVVALGGGVAAMVGYILLYRLWLYVRGDAALLLPVIIAAHGPGDASDASPASTSGPTSAWGKPLRPPAA